MSYNADTMSFEAPDTDCIYFEGLNLDSTEQEVSDYFGSIGIIKKDKKTKKPMVWLYRDKMSGGLKGDGTVTYEDPFTAGSAVNWFNGKEFKGSIMTVKLADRKSNKYDATAAASFGGGGGFGGGRRDDYGGGGGGYGGGGGFGGGGGGGGRGQPRPGDWPCPSCGNNCFASKMACNRCGTPKPADAGGGGYGGGGGGGGGFGGGGGGFGGGGGRGGGRGGPRPGDWPCPSCNNNCFASKMACNRCGTPKPEGAGYAGMESGGGGGGGYGGGGGGYGGGGGRGGGGGYGGGRDGGGGYGGGRDGGGGGGGGRDGGSRTAAAPQGPPGMFAPEDWPCPSCGNVNWARRQTCNQCNTAKPGTVDVNREGQAGGFKELDESELEESRRRRRDARAKDDGDAYDEFGRLKKSYRGGDDRKAREEAALARLRGDGGGRRERSRSPRRDRGHY